MRRAWINQPSTLQPLHALHGLQVLAEGSRIYFLGGDTVSMETPPGCLSDGWPEVRRRAAYYFCRYVRTDEIKTPARKGYTHGPLHFPSVPIAAVHVYRLKRQGAPLLLTQEEARAIQDAMTEEGQPHLLPEAEAIEGKAL